VGSTNGKTEPLPARRSLTSDGVRDQLLQVHAELLQGTRKRLKAQQARQLAAGMVFSYWAAKTNSERSLLDHSREARIVERLKESAGDVGELLYAIDGAMSDTWHNGDKDGTKRLGIEYLFRNRAKIEELASRTGGYKKGNPHPMAEKYAEIFNQEQAA
jgi:hypothetical protein